MATPIPHNVQSLPRPLYSPRGHFVLLSGWPKHKDVVVTVEVYMKWCGLILVRSALPSLDGIPSLGPRVEEVPFPESKTLTPYIDHAPNPVVVEHWADEQGYMLEELALEMMIGRWQLARY